MREFLLEAHSGWRYLVLLAIVVTTLFYTYEYFAKKKTPYERPIDLAFTTSIHIQILLGILLLLADLFSDFFEAKYIGHTIVMLLLIPLTIYYSKSVKVLDTASPERRRRLGIITPIAALLVIIVAIAAIQRNVIG